MARVAAVEFFKFGKAGAVGKVLETQPIPDHAFADEAAFQEWAQAALPARRGDNSIMEWPDAVRFCAVDGDELFRWTCWDQLNVGKAIATAKRS